MTQGYYNVTLTKRQLQILNFNMRAALAEHRAYGPLDSGNWTYDPDTTPAPLYATKELEDIQNLVQEALERASM